MWSSNSTWVTQVRIVNHMPRRRNVRGILFLDNLTMTRQWQWAVIMTFCLLTFKTGFKIVTYKNSNRISLMIRLKSGIFWIFDFSKWRSNLTSSNCRALKIILNDTKPEPISWELFIENPILNFCVGVWVGGYHRANFSYRYRRMRTFHIFW